MSRHQLRYTTGIRPQGPKIVRCSTRTLLQQYNVHRHSLRHVSPFARIRTSTRLLLLSTSLNTFGSPQATDDRLSPPVQQGRQQGQQQHQRNPAHKKTHTNATCTDSTFLAELQEPILGGRRLGRVGVFPSRRRRRRRRVSLCQHSEKVHSSLDGVRFPYNSLPASLS